MKTQDDPTLASNGITPLRNIPITITVEGVSVTGEIVMLQPSDMSVIITSPSSGLGTSLHVPHFAMPSRALATIVVRTTQEITKHGRDSAAWLLRQLYDRLQGHPSGWGMYSVGRDGWIPLASEDDW